MLDYENQMFLDILNEDALVIAAKGLGLEDVVLSLLKVYCDPGNLVLVLGTSAAEEAFYLEKLLLDGVSPLPKAVTTESGTVQQRKELYLEGGVLFVSPRILVVDLLKERLPLAHVTGVIVCRAHAVAQSCQEAFALRLFRQKNKTGFVKAFSNSAEAFRSGFCQLGRVMKMLFLRQVFLWPRFHSIVQSSLGACKPVVTEMLVELTPRMTRLQNAILELLAFVVKEVKRINPSLDLEELTVENAVAKSFHKVLQGQLDPVWNQLSAKTKTLVADLKLLRVFLSYLTRYDCVTFEGFVSSFRTQSYALQSSGWLLLDSANVLFATAKQRLGQVPPSKPMPVKATETADPVETEPTAAEVEAADSDQDLLLSDEDIFASPSPDKRRKAAKPKAPRSPKKLPASGSRAKGEEGPKSAAKKAKASETKGGSSEEQELLEPEPNPKWLVLKQILTEIKDISKETAGDFVTPEKVLILVQDKRTAKQLQELLMCGTRELFTRLRQRKVAAAADAESRAFREGNARSPSKLFSRNVSASDRDIDLQLCTQMLAPGAETLSSPSETEVQVAAVSDGLKDVYILSQTSVAADDEPEKYQTFAEKLSDLDVSLEPTEDAPVFQPPVVVIQTFKVDGNPLSLPEALDITRPRFIVLYDVEVTAVRRIEVYQSNVPSPQVHVYFVVFGGSVEEQAYLTALRREKESFEALINEKATMVVPADQDGKSETCEALSRDSSTSSEAASSRRGDRQVPSKRSTIIVDMREFNSELPAMIHRRGIEMEPVTLQVGDYILTPEICVERKSVSDLIGSLGNGRLYNQATAMTRFYAKPILLIEFDDNKPLTLQGNYYISKDMSNSDITAKLILLTLHFPDLRLVWSPSPYATAQLFEELKQSREEPSADRAAGVGADLEQDLDVAERYNPAIHDLIARLPGVTSRRLHALLDSGHSLDRLLPRNVDSLSVPLGNRGDAQLFHDGLHKTATPPAEAGSSKRGRWRGKGRGFRR